MPYTVKQLADLAGISVRTLHHYDQVGLLKPAEIRKNGYRAYGERELLLLQQILFFRELEVPLDDIKRIITAKNFDMRRALQEHRKLISQKRARMDGLLVTIDRTIKKLHHDIPMDDKDLYAAFSKEEREQLKEYEKEAEQRWGNTDAWQQSRERMKKMSPAQIKKLKDDGEIFLRALADAMPAGPKSEKFQALIAQHYEGLRTFYDPSPELYRGLAEMYVADPRFAAYHEKAAVGLAECMRIAMLHYVETLEKKA